MTNPNYGSKALVNETDGTYKDFDVECPTLAWADCPYCDQCFICHCKEPWEDCDDFGSYYDDGDDYLYQVYGVTE